MLAQATFTDTHAGSPPLSNEPRHAPRGPKHVNWRTTGPSTPVVESHPRRGDRAHPDQPRHRSTEPALLRVVSHGRLGHQRQRSLDTNDGGGCRCRRAKPASSPPAGSFQPAPRQSCARKAATHPRTGTSLSDTTPSRVRHSQAGTFVPPEKKPPPEMSSYPPARSSIRLILPWPQWQATITFRCSASRGSPSYLPVLKWSPQASRRQDRSATRSVRSWMP